MVIWKNKEKQMPHNVTFEEHTFSRCQGETEVSSNVCNQSVKSSNFRIPLEVLQGGWR